MPATRNREPIFTGRFSQWATSFPDHKIGIEIAFDTNTDFDKFQNDSKILSLSKGHTMREQVQAAIDKIRPMLKADGGDVELVDVKEDGTVQVRLQGACSGCPMSQMTLKNGIERIIKENVPEVKVVEAV
jgi:Fe-S cluster biogenesis protein NfuA